MSVVKECWKIQEAAREFDVYLQEAFRLATYNGDGNLCNGFSLPTWALLVIRWKCKLLCRWRLLQMGEVVLTVQWTWSLVLSRAVESAG